MEEMEKMMEIDGKMEKWIPPGENRLGRESIL